MRDERFDTNTDMQAMDEPDTRQNASEERPPGTKRFLTKNKIFLCVFVAAAVYSGVSIASQSAMIAEQNAQRYELEQEFADLTHELELMEMKSELVDTDAHITQVARESLGLVKEGEIVYTDEEPDTQGMTVSPEQSEEE